MRRDTQIGIILGVVILVIIGVFLGTRSSIEGPNIQDTTSHGKTKTNESEIVEIGIDELVREMNAAETFEEITPLPGPETQEIVVEKQQTTDKFAPEIDEGPDEESVSTIEGQWEGTGEEIAEEITDDEEVETKAEIAEEIVIDTGPETYAITTPWTEVTHIVVKNDRLYNISIKYYDDGSKWPMIFEANRNILDSPNSLKPGMELLIPDLETAEEMEEAEVTYDRRPSDKTRSSERTHKVVSGDSLFKIARKYYDDYNMWEMIYEANLDKIDNKHSLEVGQILIIPQ